MPIHGAQVQPCDGLCGMRRRGNATLSASIVNSAMDPVDLPDHDAASVASSGHGESGTEGARCRTWARYAKIFLLLVLIAGIIAAV
eukprot:990124-Rhodomonas_salina.1